MRAAASLTPLALALALAVGCAGAPASGAPAGAGDAGDAARLYRAKCTACHRAYEPGSRTASQWMAVLDRMAPKARLTPEQRAALDGWLRAHASDAPAGGAR